MDRETPMLLPADLREWVPADDLVHSEAGIPGVAAPGAGSTAGASEPPPPPKDSQQINFTDPDSALMRKNRRDSCERASNAQAAVDVGDSHLILGTVQRVLADGGYVNAELIESVGSTVDLDVAMPHWGFASFFFEGWRRCVSNGIVPAWLAT